MPITYFKLDYNFFEVFKMYERLRNLREDKELTQKQVGEILNMSQTGYNQYEIRKKRCTN